MYDDTPNATVSEIINLNSAMSKESQMYVPITISQWENGSHLLSTIHLQNTLVRLCVNLYLNGGIHFCITADWLESYWYWLVLKHSKCTSYLLDGHHHSREGIQLSGGSTRSVTYGGTKFLGKSLDVSLKLRQKKVDWWTVLLPVHSWHFTNSWRI